MMRKNLLIIPLLLLLGISKISAQQIETGPLYKAESKYYDPTIVGEDEELFYLVEYHKSSYILAAFEKEGYRRKYSKEVVLPEMNERRFAFRQIFFSNGKLTVFASHYNKKRKESYMYAYQFDAQTGKRLGNKIDVITVENSKNVGRISWEQSPDNSKILFANESYDKKKKLTTTNYILFDGEMEELASQTLQFEGKESELNIGGVVIDNDGSVYAVSYYSKGYKMIVLDANKDFEKWTEDIQIDGLDVDEFIKGGTISMDEEGNVINIGYYSNEDGNLIGYTYMKIDGFTKEIINENREEFPKDFLDKFKTKKDVRKKRDGKLDKYLSSRIMTLENGDVVFLSEVRYVNRYYNNNGGLTAEKYFYGDLIASRFNKDGELIWINKIDKDQMYYWQDVLLGMVASSGGVSWFVRPNYLKKHFSYLSFMMEGELNVVYYENVKNKTINDPFKKKTMKNPYKGYLVRCAIDLKTGELEYNDVKQKSVDDLVLVPTSSKQSSETQDVFLMMAKKKAYKFGKLEL